MGEDKGGEEGWGGWRRVRRCTTYGNVRFGRVFCGIGCGFAMHGLSLRGVWGRGWEVGGLVLGKFVRDIR